MTRGLIRRILCVLLGAVLMLVPGCGRPQQTVEGTAAAYYVNADESGLVTKPWTPAEGDTEAQIKAYREKLTAAPEEADCIGLLPQTVSLQKAVYEKPLLTLTFNNAYAQMEPTREVLVRAGLVRMFTQIEGVTRVEIFVGKEPLRDNSGKEIGAMRRESFIDNSAQMLNNYEQDAVRLYFANASGDRLVEETRAIYHSSSQPLEWAVVARLVEGPKSPDAYSVLPADLEILSVSTAQEICYVNLGRTFLTGTPDVSAAIPIYAIVNSLVNSCNVKQVQIAVEGDIKVTFKETMDLNTLYEKDMSLVENAS